MRRTVVEHRGSRQFALVLLAVGSLVLAGCSSSSPVDPTTPTSSAPTTSIESSGPAVPPTTASPTPSPAVYKPATDQGPAENVPVPALPDKAKEFSKEGLIAFAEYWYSTLGYAFETGDPEPMMAISGPNCLTCEAMSSAVGPWHADGRWIVGGQMRVLSMTASFEPLQNGEYELVALVRQTHLKFYRGDKTLSDDRGQKPSVADLVTAFYESGQWIAHDVSRLKG